MAKENPYIEIVNLSSTEREIVSSFGLSESVVISLDQVADVLQLKKKELANRLLDVGLQKLIQTIRDTRPELADDNPSSENPDGKCWTFLTPAEIREVKAKLGGGALQYDFVDEKESKVS
jgi:hypothetical protein